MILTIGQIASKQGADYFEAGLSVLGMQFVALGYLMLMLRGIFWILILKKMSLSQAYPLLSIAYVIIPFMSYYLFSENISFFKIMGGVIITIGIVVSNR